MSAVETTETVYAVVMPFKNISSYEMQVMDYAVYETREEAEKIAAEIRDNATSEIVAYVEEFVRDTSDDEKRIAVEMERVPRWSREDAFASIRSSDAHQDETLNADRLKWIRDDGQNGPMVSSIEAGLSQADYVQAWVHETKLRRYGTVSTTDERPYENQPDWAFVVVEFDGGGSATMAHGDEESDKLMYPDGLPAAGERVYMDAWGNLRRVIVSGAIEGGMFYADITADESPNGVAFRGPDRATAEEAAQDAVDYLNAHGGDAA
jgi:hypothetical protein